MKKLLLLSALLIFACSSDDSTSDYSSDIPDDNYDNLAPVITILGDALVTIIRGETYNDAGATAIDDVDGDLTSSIVINSNLDTANLGIYNIEYTVSDLAGNTAVSFRQVTVVEDTTATINIGDYIEGGVVFWIDPTDETHGLVCACLNYPNEGWGQSGALIGNTSTSLGSGSSNTDKIIEAGGANAWGAAQQARTPRRGYDDWFLPSKDELNELVGNAEIVSDSCYELFEQGIIYESYWSSSEYDIGNAWGQTVNGSTNGIQKDNFVSSTKSHPVRSF
tara:strand:+ start:871 stop:1707 length:837 start_codon:yes stop_codon:yes gene_type:complete